jgi:hypothetical protein
MKIFLALTATAGLLLGLSACGGSSNKPADAQSSVKKTVVHHGAADPSARSPEDMVTAVSPCKAGPPVELKFELREAPKAGEALEVDVAILPDAPAINRLYGKFSGGDGVDLVDGGDLAAVDKPPQGTAIRHLLRVLPKKDGIYTVNATVTVDLADDSVTRTFSIPLIVGDGLADMSAKAESDGKDTAPKAR